MMTKPEDIPQSVWDDAEIALKFVPAGSDEYQIASVARAILSAVEEERSKHTVALADLDSALCQFLNNVGDEYDPRVWVPSIKRDLGRLAKAYNQCHALGTMDIRASVENIRNRKEPGNG